MRKLLGLCLFILLLVGCTKDPSSSNDNPSRLSPPSWIIGTWEGGIEFTFTSNDVLLGSGDTTLSLTYAYQEVPLTDVSSDIMYKVIVGIPEAYYEYIFDKISSDSLSFTQNIDGIIVGPVGLKKR